MQAYSDIDRSLAVARQNAYSLILVRQYPQYEKLEKYGEIRKRLRSTLIRHENGAFSKTLFKPWIVEEFENVSFSKTMAPR